MKTLTLAALFVLFSICSAAEEVLLSDLLELPKTHGSVDLSEATRDLDEIILSDWGEDAWNSGMLLNFYHKTNPVLFEKILQGGLETPEQLLETIKTHGDGLLKGNDAALAGIKSYTLGGYSELNGPLWRSQPLSTEQEALLSQVNTFIDIFSGDEKHPLHFLARGTAVKVKDLKNWLSKGDGEEILYHHKGFGSYSASPEVALNYVGKNPLSRGEFQKLKEGKLQTDEEKYVSAVFLRATEKGANILLDSWSEYAGELEVVLKPETFKITKVISLAESCSKLNFTEKVYSMETDSELPLQEVVNSLNLVVLISVDSGSDVQPVLDEKLTRELCETRAYFRGKTTTTGF